MNNQPVFAVFLQPQADLFIVRPAGVVFWQASKKRN
jgi:hypothetical protein